MRNAIVVGIICLVLGFAAGWVAKPGNAGDGAPGGEMAAAKPERQRAGDADSDSGKLATKTDRARESSDDGEKAAARTIVIENGKMVDQDDETIAQVEDMENRMQKAMVDRQRKKFDARIAKLVADLGLDATQEKQLREFYESKLDEIGGKMKDGDDPGFAGMKELAGMMRGEGLDAHLERILTAEQQQEYEAMKEKERVTKLDSKALKNMARVNEVVSLQPDQKEAVYDLLYEDAEKDLNSNNDTSAFMSVFTEGMGIEIDPDALGISGAIEMQMEAADGREVQDPQAMMKAMRESQQNRIDEKVERLSPVLDEQQLDQYRSHLEAKSSGFFGGMMMGVEEEVEVEVE